MLENQMLNQIIRTSFTKTPIRDKAFQLAQRRCISSYDLLDHVNKQLYPVRAKLDQVSAFKQPQTLLMLILIRHTA